MAVLSDSLYLDMTSYRMLDYTPATTVQDAYGITSRPADEIVNVAITLPRANDPTALLISELGHAPDDAGRSRRTRDAMDDLRRRPGRV